MTKTINRLADRIVGLVLPHADAGACAPNFGQTFWNYCGGCYCRAADLRWVQKQCACRVNCTGECVSTGATRCVLTNVLC